MCVISVISLSQTLESVYVTSAILTNYYSLAMVVTFCTSASTVADLYIGHHNLTRIKSLITLEMRIANFCDWNFYGSMR